MGLLVGAIVDCPYSPGVPWHLPPTCAASILRAVNRIFEAGPVAWALTAGAIGLFFAIWWWQNRRG